MDILGHEDPFSARPCGPRTYRPTRQRASVRSSAETKIPPTWRLDADEAMELEAKDTTVSPAADDLLNRATLCLPHLGRDVIVHGGDDGFKDVLRQYFPLAESNASERLVDLKSRLRAASTTEFWGVLMEEMCDIVGAQCGFVAKRMLVDDQDSAVEMPELGEPGSCLMGIAFYINNGADVKQLHRDYRYHAYGTPCAHMKHDKVFIVPEKMTEFVRNNPNAMPWKKSEAFIGVPLFAEGKCFAHFGMVWSAEGASKKKLGWSFIEMFMHSLEDIILQRILEGRGFAKEIAAPDSTPAKVIPLTAIMASQSLQPYARSLSHELRTPMQGVVGMLDIMYATVVDAIANQQSDRARSVFEELKKDIELVQESSRRAVEAADNVVHAYDLNLQMPEVSLTPSALASSSPEPDSLATFPATVQPQGDLESPQRSKRGRSEELDVPSEPVRKKMFNMTETEVQATYNSDETTTPSGGLTMPSTAPPSEPDWGTDKELPSRQRGHAPSVIPSPRRRRVNTKDFMKGLVSEALQNGHPTEEVHHETELGERIEFRTVGPRGEIQDRTILLEIEPDVPEFISTEEQQLQFALQKLIDNALKFTQHGQITITVKICRNFDLVEIRIVDTGCGISEESQTNLFKPHFQEDASIIRAKDGLGLSLFNAKAHVRKNLGGDVTLERSATYGPTKGSVFLIQLPIISADFSSNSSVPLASNSHNDDIGTTPTAEELPQSLRERPSSPAIKSQTSERRSLHKQPSFDSALAKKYPLNILIVEDNVIVRTVVIGALKKLGYQAANITVAFDGADAVNLYKSSLDGGPCRHFDFILMDIWMPNMDGYEATANILRMAQQSGISTKIVAATAAVTDESKLKAENVGMHGFLAKPYTMFDLQKQIVEHFSLDDGSRREEADS